MGYRDDQAAQRLRVEKLEADLHEARAEIAGLRAGAPSDKTGAAVTPARGASSSGSLAPSVLLALAGVALAVAGLADPAAPWAPPTFGLATVLVVLGLMLLLGRLVRVARPYEALVVIGRRTRLPDGTLGSFAVKLGGRVVRRPVVELVHALDRRVMRADAVVPNAICHGGARVELAATALVKVTSDASRLRHAVERFLHQPPAAIAEVAKGTLEGAMREVASEVPLETLDEERLKVAARVTEHAAGELDKLGLEVVGLWLLRVEDDERRLEAQVRMATAKAIRAAETKGRIS